MGEFLARHGISITSAPGLPMSLQELATIRAVRQGEEVRHLQETIRRPDQTSLSVLVNALALDAPQGWPLLRSGTEVMGAAYQQCAETVALIMHQDVSPLKEAERIKDKFIGIAAHELRNPLGALKGFASMLTYQSAEHRGLRSLTGSAKPSARLSRQQRGWTSSPRICWMSPACRQDGWCYGVPHRSGEPGSAARAAGIDDYATACPLFRDRAR